MTPNPDEVPVSGELALSEEVADALYLLEHLVSSGYTREDKMVDKDIVETIKVTAALLGVQVLHGELARRHEPVERSLSAAQWIAFELAYNRLSVFAAPMTAQTLRDTRTPREGGSLRMFLFGQSAAQRFTWWLWIAALMFAGLVVCTQWGMRRFGPVFDGNVDWPNTSLQLLEILTPYFYGGLGACVYLLRSAHQYIYQRTFDLQRRSEYFNRILLGTVGGGAIMLFVDHVSDDSGQVVTLSSAALGFLAGYSTDFLFSAIERIINAVLPKVGLDTVQHKAPAGPVMAIGIGDTDLAQLLDRYQAAQTDDEKQLYKSLIDKIRERL